MLQRIRVGSHKQYLKVRIMRVTGPYLLAIDHEVIALQHRTRLQRREIGAGVRLGIALAPNLLTAEHRWQKSAAVRLSPDAHKNRSEARDRLHRHAVRG